MTLNYDMYNFIRTATADQLADIALKMIALHPDTFESLAVGLVPQIVQITFQAKSMVESQAFITATT